MSENLSRDFDDGSDTLIPVIILTIVIIFIGIMIYLMIDSRSRSTSTASTTISVSETLLSCPTGECATNVFTGYKRCPTGTNEQISINSASEVCNPRFSCTNNLTPFALLSNGSTDNNGICDDGVQCACLTEAQCPDYIQSTFTASNGNPFTFIGNQRILFPQTASYITSDNVVSNTPPFIYNVNTTFCLIPFSWLSFSSPGCNFLDASQPNSFTYPEFLACMGLSNNCNSSSTVPANPCLAGTLALISDSPDTETIDSIYTAQFGCVSGTNNCECDETPVFDTGTGLLTCRNLELQTPFP